MRQSFLILASLVFVYLFNSCAVNPVTGKKEFMLLSQSEEKEMGESSDPDIVSMFGIYDDPQLQNFIDQKGTQMASISHRPDLGYDFKIVDSPVVNAFAVPGGYVYFTRGIMAHFNNEAEFAGVLGHEIGHITARHSAKQYSKSMVAQVGLGLGTILSERFAQLSGVAQSSVSLLFLKFGRDAERESDKLGVEYSSEIGYDAHQMADFFATLSRLSESSGQQMPNFLSTHPQPGERYATVHTLAEKYQSKNEKSYAVNRDNYLDLIDGLVYGEDPRQGFVENSTFYHPELKFQFNVPTNWPLQNSPTQVQIAPQDGSAVTLFTLSSSQSLNTAATQVLATYDLQQIQASNTTINGLPALTMLVSQQSEAQNLKGEINLIDYNNNIYLFLSLTSDQNYAAYQTQLGSAARVFRPLTDPSKLNKQPERIKIQQVTKTQSLQNQLRTYRISQNRYQELAILNGMELSDPVTSGTKIKLIQ